MSTDFEGKLTYRDYVAHIFTGVIFNVFLLAALFPVLPDKWWEYDFNNEFIWSLAAIPILYLEGHFIHAINRFLLVAIPKWWFIFRVKCFRRKQEKGQVNANNDSILSKYSDKHYRIAAYRLRMEWYEKIFEKCKFLFFLFLSVRISGQKIVRKDKDGDLVKIAKTEMTIRYYVLSDFFKAVGCAALISLIVAACFCNCWAVGVMFAIIFLSRQRARYFSMLYVKYRYKKKDTEEEPIEKKNG